MASGKWNWTMRRGGATGAALLLCVAMGAGCGSSSSPPAPGTSTGGPPGRIDTTAPGCNVTPILEGGTATGTRQTVTVTSGGATLQATTEILHDGSWHRTEKISRGARVVVSVDLRGSQDGRIEGSETFDPQFSGGMHKAIVSGRTAATLDITVDGKPLAGIPLDQLKNGTMAPLRNFRDGSALPKLPPDAQLLVNELVNKSSAAAASCTPAGTPAGAPVLQPRSAPLPGSGPGGSACDSCKQDCGLNLHPVYDQSGSLVGCAIEKAGECATYASAGLLCGPFAGLCAGIIWVACEVLEVNDTCFKKYDNCVSACNGSSACCPVKCGSLCCQQGQTCADPTNGLCCGAGNTVCKGTDQITCDDPQAELCLPTGEACTFANLCDNNTKCCSGFNEKCVHDTGINAEYCCDGTTHDICGPNHCCASGTCIGNGSSVPYQCCASVDQTCGSTCCKSGERCVNNACKTDTTTCDQFTQLCTQTGYLSVCCLGQQGCAAGQCCPLGQTAGDPLLACDPTQCYPRGTNCIK